MRPIKLTLSGFESYMNETVIDFSKFGKADLFLISGETGSGKTSIFDAIKFALYGEASGNERSANGLISTSIADKLNSGDTAEFSKGYRPFVELIFEVNGKKYTVLRKPGYSITGKSSKQSDAEITSEDGSITETKVKAVNEKIVELVGLKSEQFSSVAMIAQGEFSKLVSAEKKERAEILKEIFGITKFEEFKRLLKEEKDNAYSEKSSSETAILTHINGIKTDEENSFADSVKTAVADADSFNLVPVYLEKYIDEDKCKYNENGEKLASVQKEYKENTSNITLLEQKKDFEKTVKECTDNIKKFRDAQKTFENTKQRLEGQKKSIDDISKKKTVIESKLSKYSELSETEKTVKTLTEEANNLKGEIDRLKTDIEKKDSRHTNIKEELKAFKDISVDKANAEAEIEKLKIRHTELEKLSEDLTGKNNLHKDLLVLQEKASNDSETYLQEQTNLTAKTDLYLKEQAGILAKDLTEGMPCPVCGNTHHIKKAVLSENAVTKEEIDKLSVKLEGLRQQANKSSEDTGKVLGSYNAKKEAFEKKFGELLPGKLLENSAEVIRTEVNTVSEQCKVLNSKIEEYKKQIELQNKLNSESEEIEKELPGLREDLNKKSSDFSAQNTEISEKRKHIEDIAKELEFSTEAEANQQIEKYKLQLEKYETDVKSNTENLTGIAEKINTESGKLQHAQTSLNNLPELDEEKINADKDRLEKNKESIESELEKLDKLIFNNENCLNSINDEKKNYEKLSENFGILDTMYKVANGTMSGTSRVAFETYILSYYFRRIVSRANERLKRITTDQYRLALPDDGTLELDVIDTYNNTRREAKSLSGGEKFKAALSLAFGFADIMGGGNRLESLFIDEGFGSLSESDLRAVLNLLIEQSGGNKLIGIISHVDEMKNSIGNKILVEKDHSGCSCVKIRVGE